jgi:hypothetical protein
MKLTSRKKLLEEADIELKKISESVSRRTSLTEDSNIEYKLDKKLRQLYKIAKEIEQVSETNDSDKGSWRTKPVRSKWALKNLPTTNDPTELQKREKIAYWEELNEKLVDSWADYLTATTPDDPNIVTKELSRGFFGDPELYNLKTLEPIPSIKYPGKTMKLSEYVQRIEKKKKENRKGIGGFLLNLLDELSWSMIP